MLQLQEILRYAGAGEPRTLVAWANPWLTVHNDPIVRADGSAGTQIVVRNGDGAMVLAMRAGDLGPELLVQSEHRYPVDRVVHGFPGGGIDPAEDPGYSAARELAEETGLEVTQMRHCGTFHTNAALLTGTLSLYVASVVGSLRPDPETGATSQWVPATELRRRIASDPGSFDGVSLAAYGLAVAQRLIPTM